MKVRKILARIALILAGVGLLLWGVHQFYPLPWVKISGFRAVPKYSVFLLEVSSFRQTPSPWDAWELAQHWDLLREFENTLRDTADTSSDPFGNTLALLQPLGKAQMGWIGIWEVKGAPERLSRWLDTHPAQVSRFRKVPIYSGKTENNRPFAVAQFRNLLIAAPFPFLVEDAIRQLTGFSFDRLPFSPGEPGRIAIQPGQLSRQWTNVLTEEGRQAWDLFRGWNGWAEMSPQADSMGWTASGNWFPGRDTTWLHTLSAAPPANPDPFFSILPDQTLAFFWSARMQESWWSAGAGRRLLKPWWDGEWAAGLLPGYGDQSGSSLFWVGKIQSQEAFDAWLEQWASEQGELPRHPYQTFEIRRIMAEPVLPLPWTNRPLELRNPFLVQLEDCVVFAESKPALEVWLDQYIAGQVLGRADFFLESRSRLPEKALAWTYMQNDRFGRTVEATFQPKQGLPFLEKGLVQLALVPGKESIRLEAVGRSGEVFPTAITIAWKANLSAPALIAPSVISDGGGYSWLVQDSLFDLYRLSAEGGIAWKRPLAGKVLSDFFPLAYYSHEPKELVFNTHEAIYLLDDLGQMVSTYPLRLLSPATNGMLLADFSGKGDYGMFLACENGRIYGFDRYGRPLEGWSPGPEIGRVSQPMRHFQHDGKDFLVALTEEGMLHVFQRDGSRRFEPVKIKDPVAGAPGVQALPLSARIVVGAQKGSVQVINTEGKSFTLATPVGTNEKADFRFEDVTGDERYDYLMMSGNEVALYYYEGEEFKLKAKIRLERPQDELVAGKGYFGTVDLTRRQIFLFTPEGLETPGFPLAGSSAFSIVRLPEGRLLVSALGADVYAYWLP